MENDNTQINSGGVLILFYKFHICFESKLKVFDEYWVNDSLSFQGATSAYKHYRSSRHRLIKVTAALHNI